MKRSHFDMDISKVKLNLEMKERKADAAAIAAMQKGVDDLERIATNIAPIDTGQLRRSATKSVKPMPGGVVMGEVGFSAYNESFNYAIWTHEMPYNLGPQSQAAPGTDGYSVGNKYLSRPLYGEAPKYLAWWAAALGQAIKD